MVGIEREREGVTERGMVGIDRERGSDRERYGRDR